MKYYTISQGSGQSDLSDHAGSYHIALKACGVHDLNHKCLSSLIPKGYRLITVEEAKEIRCKRSPDNSQHAEKVDSIQSRSTGTIGDVISAGMGIAWLYDEYFNEIGGIVVEVSSKGLDPINDLIRASLLEVHQNGFEQYQLLNVEYYTETLVVEKKFGTALINLSFV